VRALRRQLGLSTVALRYFTVYGPRQRPDMATHRILRAGLRGEPFPLYGDGSAVRDFTFVGDVVARNVAAATGRRRARATVLNVAGGGETSMADLLALAGEVLGTEIEVERHDSQPGDVEKTGGNIDRTTKALGWTPRVKLEQGLRKQARGTSNRMCGDFGAQSPEVTAGSDRRRSGSDRQSSGTVTISAGSRSRRSPRA
jgi:nucleoside-diphosphate-sugar epimerase